MKNKPIFQKIIGISLMIMILTACATTSGDFLSENFSKVRASHQKIAILPFKVRFARQPNDDGKNTEITRKFYADQEFEASKDAQKELFVQLAKQVQKGRIEIAIQDFNRTNKVLDEKNIRVERLNGLAMGNLAKILEVDAIIFGEMEVRITRPNEFSMVPPNRMNDGIELITRLFDAQSGELLWNTNLTERPNSPTDTPHRISTNLISQVVKALPYRIKR